MGKIAFYGNNNKCLEILVKERKGLKRKIRFLCNVCNEEHTKKLSQYLFGYGCTTCANKKRATNQLISFDDAVKRCQVKHGTRYAYRRLDPPERSDIGQIIVYWCNVCNTERKQPLHDHLKGHGCKICNMNGADFSMVRHMMRFYLVRLHQYDRHNNVIDTAYKIGCTKSKINRRFSGMLPPNVQLDVIYNKEFTPGNIAFKLEQVVRKQFQVHRYCGDIFIFNGGNNELFTTDGVDEILAFIKEYVDKL